MKNREISEIAISRLSHSPTFLLSVPLSHFPTFLLSGSFFARRLSRESGRRPPDREKVVPDSVTSETQFDGTDQGCQRAQRALATRDAQRTFDNCVSLDRVQWVMKKDFKRQQLIFF